ncbi:hypothetical protein Y032_1063g3522 [Ancylostoma ceylanicum]|uniref:Uncharacterized protein n=1 Tax=Ancylostoma ceylanicum TaxID=53326 RepID=A0A016W8S3_9BILA|nr:hypothetical protein Y032_1063g3522 [Ancylostoma ceylanicum]
MHSGCASQLKASSNKKNIRNVLHTKQRRNEKEESGKSNSMSAINVGATSEQASLARVRHNHDLFMSKYAELMRRKGYLPEIFLVHETSSSQYVDEDGDIAHEFYAEHKSTDGQLRRLHRVLNNLRPKGKERYAIPRLSPDVPVVMWEVEQQC